jgi:sulfur relay (sulfurtransferase) complex TusBCD TusD component (DsrE family)
MGMPGGILASRRTKRPSERERTHEARYDLTRTDPETVLNALRLALYSLDQGDEVRIFFSGRGVEIDQIGDPRFDVKAQAQKALDGGGQFLACVACLKLLNCEGSEVCPLSTLKDHDEIVRDSDRVVTI